MGIGFFDVLKIILWAGIAGGLIFSGVKLGKMTKEDRKEKKGKIITAAVVFIIIIALAIWFSVAVKD